MPEILLKKFMQSRVLDRYDPATQASGRGHVVELDSLRGVAAMVVVFGHFAKVWMEASPPHFVAYLFYIPILMKPDSAVMLFFVLSGFVLTLPMLSTKRQSYPAYVVRRVCRIYLPYVAALLFAVAGCWRFHGLDIYGPDFQAIWRSTPTLALVGRHLAFLGRYDVFAFDPPVWSLVHEMRISLIFPLLCLISLRMRAWAAFAVAFSFPIAGRLIARLNTPYYGDNYSAAMRIFWSETIGFCGVFLIGSLLARYRHPIVSWLIALPAWLHGLVAASAIAVYEYPEYLRFPRPLRPFTVGLGAAYFVMLALVPGGWLSRLLHLAPLRFLGRISYSLYLIHTPIMMLMSIAIWREGIATGAILLPYLAITIGAATTFHRFVEVPSIALGKAITAKWRRSATVDAGVGRVTEPAG